LRPAVDADVDAVVALVESAYRGAASRAGWTTEADLLGGQRTDVTEVSSSVRDEDSRVLVAEVDGTIVGCCRLTRSRGPAASFGLFAVRPELQGRGLGRSILAEAERVARDEWGADELRMQVIRQREDLLAWYRRLGYVETGSTVPFPYGDERFGRPLRPDLEFVVLSRSLR
jgi:ribosomal protein S18 acetylase RimI-like enzyme